MVCVEVGGAYGRKVLVEGAAGAKVPENVAAGREGRRVKE